MGVVERGQGSKHKAEKAKKEDSEEKIDQPRFRLPAEIVLYSN